MPGSGALDRRVVFQQRAVDDNGDRLGDWEDALPRWCQITWLRGGEGVLDGRLAGNAPAILTVRDDPETRRLNNAWRARTESGIAATFDIKGPGTPSKDAGFIDLLATAGAELRGADE
jgi:head-tail adaptor